MNFNFPFTEAIRFALSRGVVLPDTYYERLTSAGRQRAISVAGLASLEQVKSVIDSVNKHIADGGTFRDFKKSLTDGNIDVELPDYRLNNIFRTNAQSAYAHGRWQQQWANRADRPYLMYDAVNDSRTRPSHAKLDNLIRHMDDKIWDTLYVPNGYMCRCTIRALTDAQAQAKGGETLNLEGLEPDKGWDNSPKQYSQILSKKLADWGTDIDIKTMEGISSLNDAKTAIQDALSATVSDVQIIKNWIDDKKIAAYANKFKSYSNPYGLSVEQYTALRHYTAGGSASINDMLNGISGGLNNREVSNLLDASLLLSRSLNKLPNYEGRVVRRTSFSKSVLDEHKIGHIVLYNAFTSATYANKDVFEHRPVRLIIHTVSGKVLGNISTYNEKEVLIGRNKVFKVLGRIDYESFVEITLEEINLL